MVPRWFRERPSQTELACLSILRINPFVFDPGPVFAPRSSETLGSFNCSATCAVLIESDTANRLETRLALMSKNSRNVILERRTAGSLSLTRRTQEAGDSEGCSCLL